MERQVLQASGTAPAIGYAPALFVSGASRMLFISGQVPVAPDGMVPQGIEAQTRQVWANILSLLAAAGMTADNLAKVTVFLSNGALRGPINAVSDEIMNGRLVAWTTVIVGILQDDWMLEIEAIAVA